MELPSESELFEAYLGKAAYEMSSLGTRIRQCQRCVLSKEQEPLAGAGYPLADLFLLKAQVASSECQRGVAFTGPAVEALGKAFQKLDADISQVYGTNALKCKAQEGKAGEEELKACAPYLRAEVEICQPRVILVMGPVALFALQEAYRNLGEIGYQAGTVIRLRPNLQLVLTSDLDASLMEEESKRKRRFWKDLQCAKSIVDKELAREEKK